MKRYSINPLHYLLAALTILIITLFSVSRCQGQDLQLNVQTTEKNIPNIDTVKVCFLYITKWQDVSYKFGWVVTKYDWK